VETLEPTITEVQRPVVVEAPPRFPAHVSRFDLATRDELLYAHWISPFVSSSDVRQWTWIKELVNQTGKWVGTAVDFGKIADAIQQGLSIEGQPALSKLDDLVQDCAQRLGVAKPTVIVRSSSTPAAYLVDAHSETFLVLTSEMLQLFDGAEDELRFIVGRELGHLKCEHLEVRRATLGLITVLNAVNQRVVPEEGQFALPTLLVGRMLTWMREAEISADRAGLICCGRPQTAYNALARLLHGLPSGSEMLDPNHPDFDAQRIVDNFERWEQEPLFKFVTLLQQQSVAALFIPQRLGALKSYAESDEYEALLARTKLTDTKTLVVVDSIEALGLADPGAGVSPFVRCFKENVALFRTKTDQWGATGHWTNIERIVGDQPGQPIYFEIWNDGFFDEFVGGFVIYPGSQGASDGIETVTTRILWNWKNRTDQARHGIATVKVRIAQTGVNDE